jgi:hypothetical protein
VLTEQEEVFGVDEVVQEGPKQSNHEQARLAEENSRLDFSSMLPKKADNKNRIVEILEDEEYKALDEYIKEEVLVKLEKVNDEDNWAKLMRVLQYLNGTRHLKFILSADAINFAIHWYIDALHQVHEDEDCRGQIGCLMTLGKGAVVSSSNKMKYNTKSSTETELIPLHDKLPWTRYFVEYQGYDIDECTIFQDNMSALLLEKNGQVSSSKQSKHIKAKYFFIKDYYDAGEVDLKYCSADTMLADVLTKPLQGLKFRDMRAFLQNCLRCYDDDLKQEEDKHG